MTDEELLASFEACTLPGECFCHREHVHMAWLYLRQGALLAAIDRFGTALRRYAHSLGKPGLYHETITWAYLLLIHERMARPGAPVTWDGFARDNPDLLQWRPSVLDSYYRPETLWSERARSMFLMPDLAR